MGGFLDKFSSKLSEKEEWQQENEKLKMEIAVLQQNAEHNKEEQRASNAEAASLKEELALTKDALENEKRVNRLMHERVLAQFQQENNLEVQNVGDATITRREEQTLIASIESKELVITELRSKQCRLQKDLENTQDELKKSQEREEMKSSEVKKLEKTCNDFFSQITGLICRQQESEAQINSLKHRIVHLDEENKILSITNQVFSLD